MAQRRPLVLGSDGLPRQLDTAVDTLKVSNAVNSDDAVTLIQLSTSTSPAFAPNLIILSGDPNAPDIMFDHDGTLMIHSTV